MNTIPLPQLDDLRLFCGVARHSSFAMAARTLGVSKALISKRIGLLEAALQVRLFHRTTRSVTLTPQGELALSWARRIAEDVDLLGEALSQERAAPAGLLRLCSSTGFGSRHLAPALSALAQAHPQMQIELELLDRPVDLIEEGFQLDLRLGHVHEGHVTARRVARNRRVLCASPAYLARHGIPHTLDELPGHRCIPIRERDQDFARWDLVGPEGAASVRVSGPLSANHGGVVRQWALDGHGIILRSTWDVQDDLAAGRLVQLLPAYHQPADVWAVCPSRLSASARVRVCVEFLQDWFSRAGLGP
ncbi:LysR family transcriptional regulator [Roseateles sp.]|uniref:LysR family transcriptional regulator n=1 Tax=Roseateles sp. TaxID=1971397 RepID=UPI002E046E10|nr:LysR family transcriptional regulator [Roseateles sp.]